MKIDVNAVKQRFPEVEDINIELLKQGISVVIVGVRKNRPKHIKQLNEQLFEEVEGFDQVKLVIYVEHTLDVHNIGDVVWSFTNNVDPRRDKYLLELDDPKSLSHIGLDGTRKSKEFDNFDRDWPNVLVTDDATIAAVDAKWEQLGLGKFIPSPSLRYQRMLYVGEAVAEE